MSPDTGKVEELLADANTFRKENRPDEAIDAIRSAVELSRELTEPDLLAKSLNELARIERDRGKTSRSIACYEEVAELMENSHNHLGVAHAMRHLGDIHQDEGRMEEADLCYSKALDIYRYHKNNSQMALANTLRGYALLKNLQDKKEEAMALWIEARSIYEENHIREGVKECNRWIRRLD